MGWSVFGSGAGQGPWEYGFLWNLLWKWSAWFGPEGEQPRANIINALLLDVVVGRLYGGVGS